MPYRSDSLPDCILLEHVTDGPWRYQVERLSDARGTCMCALRCILMAPHLLRKSDRPIYDLSDAECREMLNRLLKEEGWLFKLPEANGLPDTGALSATRVAPRGGSRPRGYTMEDVFNVAWALRVNIVLYGLDEAAAGATLNVSINGRRIHRLRQVLRGPEVQLRRGGGPSQTRDPLKTYALGPRLPLYTVDLLLTRADATPEAVVGRPRLYHADLLVKQGYTLGTENTYLGPMPAGIAPRPFDLVGADPGDEEPRQPASGLPSRHTRGSGGHEGTSSHQVGHPVEVTEGSHTGRRGTVASTTARLENDVAVGYFQIDLEEEVETGAPAVRITLSERQLRFISEEVQEDVSLLIGTAAHESLRAVQLVWSEYRFILCSRAEQARIPDFKSAQRLAMDYVP